MARRNRPSEKLSNRESAGLRFEPLLALHRRLYGMPRGWGRFDEYLKVMLNERKDDLELPLVSMNPMGREHLAQILDAYLDLDADGAASAVVAELSEEFRGLAGLRVGLVLIDDLKGAWTNRWDQEMKLRFESEGMRGRGWIVAPIWSSEDVSLDRVLMSVSCAVRRAAWQEDHGVPVSLRERMAQEGRVLVDAGWAGAEFHLEELALATKVLAPLLESRCFATNLAALFGDEAARSLGMEALGLSAGAGLELAIREVVEAARS